MKKILFILCAGIFFAGGSFAFAQNASTTPTQLPPPVIDSNSLTQEQQLIIRKQILDLFGIPVDAPLSIFDIAKGNPFGYNGIKPPSGTGKGVGPLADLEIGYATESITPGTTVTLIALSPGTNLHQSDIAWYRNNILEVSGKGQTLFSFPVGPVGSATQIKLIVRAPGGTSKQLTKTIYPARVLFSWSANGYTPNWYRGKALPIAGSDITISAFPIVQVNAARVGIKDLNYEWKVDDRVVDRERKGSNVFVMQTSAFHPSPYRVSVRIRDEQKRIRHEEFFMIKPYEPKILFYEKHSLYGLLNNRAVSSAYIKAGESSVIQFEPFHAPIDKLQETRFSWGAGSSVIGSAGSGDRGIRLSSENAALQSFYLSYDNPKDINFRGRSEALSVTIY